MKGLKTGKSKKCEFKRCFFCRQTLGLLLFHVFIFITERWVGRSAEPESFLFPLKMSVIQFAMNCCDCIGRHLLCFTPLFIVRVTAVSRTKAKGKFKPQIPSHLHWPITAQGFGCMHQKLKKEINIIWVIVLFLINHLFHMYIDINHKVLRLNVQSITVHLSGWCWQTIMSASYSCLITGKQLNYWSVAWAACWMKTTLHV